MAKFTVTLTRATVEVAHVAVEAPDTLKAGELARNEAGAACSQGSWSARPTEVKVEQVRLVSM